MGSGHQGQRLGAQRVTPFSWAMSCSCGWVAVAETMNEAVVLVEAHAGRRTEATEHFITIGAAADPQKPGQ
jgi:hypothetical protein